MRWQTDLEFQQMILKIKRKYNDDMFSTRLQGGKAFAGEQKNRELKKLLLKSKSLDKKNKIRINPKNLIEKATNNMNKTNSEKYIIAAITIEKKHWKWKS